jgi:hypothetical protein
VVHRRLSWPTVYAFPHTSRRLRVCRHRGTRLQRRSRTARSTAWLGGPRRALLRAEQRRSTLPAMIVCDRPLTNSDASTPVAGSPQVLRLAELPSPDAVNLAYGGGGYLYCLGGERCRECLCRVGRLGLGRSGRPGTAPRQEPPDYPKAVRDVGVGSRSPSLRPRAEPITPTPEHCCSRKV